MLGQPTVQKGATASALVVHGLNSSSDMMNDISAFLQDLGVNTLGIELYGHRGDYSEFKRATQQDWLDDVLRGYCRLRELGLPIVFVGYSLGGFLGPYLSTQRSDVRFEAFVLLAPAIAVHRPFEWLSWLRILGRNFSLPARAPEDYRIYSKVPVSAYWEFLDAKDTFARASLERLKIPSLILIDPRDELVSSEGLQEFIWNNNLHGFWNIIEIKSQHPYRHIIIDRETLPETAWRQIKSFLFPLIQ